MEQPRVLLVDDEEAFTAALERRLRLRKVEATSASGKAPPFRVAIWVRSAGGTFSAVAAGPSPRPSDPWQLAQ